MHNCEFFLFIVHRSNLILELGWKASLDILNFHPSGGYHFVFHTMLQRHCWGWTTERTKIVEQFSPSLPPSLSPKHPSVELIVREIKSQLSAWWMFKSLGHFLQKHLETNPTRILLKTESNEAKSYPWQSWVERYLFHFLGLVPTVIINFHIKMIWG